MELPEFKRDWLIAFINAGHEPKLDEYGDVDTFVTDNGFHNGPGCTKCGWTTCYHCTTKIPPCKP